VAQATVLNRLVISIVAPWFVQKLPSAGDRGGDNGAFVETWVPVPTAEARPAQFLLADAAPS
jgi:hypothetical protein